MTVKIFEFQNIFLITLLLNSFSICTADTGLPSIQDSAAIKNSDNNDSSLATNKKTLCSVLDSCSQRQDTCNQKFEKLLNKLNDSEKSNNLRDMKQTIREVKVALVELKEHNQKSQALISAIRKHINKMREQVKRSHEESARSRDLLENSDSDFDEVIWAF